jgi:hypothetical protein
MQASDAQATNRPSQNSVHLMELLNAPFTVRNNCKFNAFLRDRINWVEIVAP